MDLHEGTGEPKALPEDAPAPPFGIPRLLWLLMCPFVAVFRFILLDSIVEEDTFVIRFRKIILGAMAFGGLFYFMTFYDLFVLPNNGAVWYVFMTITVPTLVASWAGWLYARIKKEAPDVLFSIVIISAIGGRLPYALSQTYFDDEPCIFAYLLIALGAQIPPTAAALAMAISTTSILLNTLMFKQVGHLSEYVQPLITPPRAPIPDFIIFFVHSRMPFFILAPTVFVIFRQFNFLTQRAEAAVTVSGEIAEKLQKYDTDGVRDILQTVTKAKSLDRRLTAAFEGIVENLERYRPHLPNYVLVDPEIQVDAGDTRPRKDEHKGGGGAGGVGGLEGTLGHLSSTNRSIPRSDAGRSPMERPVGVKGSTSSFDLMNLSRQLSKSGNEIARVSSQSRVSAAEPNPLMMASAENSTEVCRLEPELITATTKVAACIITFDWLQEFNGDHCSALVRHIGAAAQNTKASLHSFVGDRLIATWNATGRIGKPEARSCQFPLQIRRAMESSSLKLKMTSMSATRIASSCFAGDSKLRLFSCSCASLWKVVHDGLARAHKHHVSITDQTTRSQAHVDVLMRGYSVLFHDDEKPVNLYQLLVERIVDPDRDQEWMYALQAGENDPNSKINNALEIYAGGDPAEAIAMMKQIPTDSDVMKDPCVLALMEEMTDAVYTPASRLC